MGSTVPGSPEWQAQYAAQNPDAAKAGTYTDVGNPDDMKFLTSPEWQQTMQFLQQQAQANPGQFQQFLNQGTQPVNFDPNASMQAWQNAQPGLFDMVGSQTGALGTQLNNIAARNARYGGEAALAAMGGQGRTSGAGMAAFGDAYANPFAQAAAQTQQAQLGLYGNLSGQQMGQFGQNYLGQAAMQGDNRNRYLQAAGLLGQQQQGYAGMMSQLAAQGADWYVPQYEYNKTDYEKFMEGVTPWLSIPGLLF